MKLYVEKKVIGGFIIAISILIGFGVYAHINNRALLSVSRKVSHLNDVLYKAEMSRRRGHTDAAFIFLLGTTVLILARRSRAIDEMLDFSHVGRSTLHRGKVNMHGAINAFQANSIDRKKCETLRVYVHTLPPAVADIGLIRQMLTNLISNAIKYSSKKEFPQVSINAFETGTEIVYSVRDNGVGFDMQYLHKLFGVFQRLHRDDEFEGTGPRTVNPNDR